jgi:lipopolysaccharide/colanic/teichoic acid biosynthesis glycosyltransferase
MAKRSFDLVLSFLGLLFLSPVLLLVAMAVTLGDGGPVFYRQERVGQGGRTFRIWKFRTMRVDADKLGPRITKDGDVRVTAAGRFLRKWKLDELPQLVNVLCGEMSLVGPRPEVPRYVALYSDRQRRVLTLRPGITDLATLEFRNEEELLAKAEDPERFYREHCIPRKVELNLQYAARASLLADLRLIYATVIAIIRRHG